MYKKYMPLILFFIISFIILFSTGYYHWWENSKNMVQIKYISDPSWSKPVPIADGIESLDYRIIAQKDDFTLFRIKKIKQTFTEELYVQKINYRGEIIQMPQLLFTHQYLRGFGVEFLNNLYHLFIIAGDSEDNLSLTYWVLDEDYKKISEKELINGLSYTGEIKTVVYHDSIYLTLSTARGKYHQIDLIKFTPATEQLLVKPITDTTVQNIYPNLTIGNNQIHLVWLERDPSKLTNTKSVDMGNEYRLMYQGFDLYCNPLHNKKYIGTASLTRSTVAPQIVYDRNNLHIVWNRFFEEKNHPTPGRWLYYTSFSPDADETIQIYRLTPLNSFAFAPSLVKDDNKFKVAYINSREQDLFLATLDTIKGELSELSRLFTNQKVGFKPYLFTDPNNKLNICWGELEKNGMKLYYANTHYPAKPGILEVLGMKVEKEGFYIGAFLWFVLLYFFIFPLFNVFTNLLYVLIPVIIFLFLIWLSRRNNRLSCLSIVNNSYLVYSSSLLIILYKYLKTGSCNFLFTGSIPPFSALPYIILSGLLGSLIFLSSIKYKPRHSILIGGICFLLFLYWINQATYVFYIHLYTF